MSDYSKMKNADLEALLKARSLPHTGKKADLVARLTEDDAQKASKTIPEDEIDWDDDDLPEPAKPAPAKEVPKAQPAATKPAAAPATAVKAAKANGTATETAAAAAPAADAAPKAPASFIAGLNSTSVDDEIERRRKRIERFRNPNDATSNAQADEELKKLARMEKFKDLSIAEKMDSALRDPQKRKRDSNDEGSRGGHKHHGNRRPSRDGGDGGKKETGKAASWMSEADRKAAEARAARFA